MKLLFEQMSHIFRDRVWLAGRITLSVLILLNCCVLGGCEGDTQPVASGDVIKVGLIGPFSGDDGQWGEDVNLGVKAALDVNPYLSNGDRVTIIIEDDQNIPQKTREAYGKLAKDEQVAAVIVFSDSKCVLGLSETVDQFKTPVLSAVSTHPEATNTWISQLVFDDLLQGTVAALYVIDELLIEHVGVVKDTGDPHSVALADTFSQKFREAGGQADLVSVESTLDDFAPILHRFKSSGVQFLYLPIGADQVIALERTTRKMDYDPGVMVSDGLLTTMILKFEEQLDLVNGMLATDVYSTSLSFTSYGKVVSNLFNDKFSVRGTTFAALGVESVSVLKESIDRCVKKTDRNCVNKQLRSTHNFAGVFGQIKIDKKGKAERPIFINRIDNGKLYFVVKVY